MPSAVAISGLPYPRSTSSATSASLRDNRYRRAKASRSIPSSRTLTATSSAWFSGSERQNVDVKWLAARGGQKSDRRARPCSIGSRDAQQVVAQYHKHVDVVLLAQPVGEACRRGILIQEAVSPKHEDRQPQAIDNGGKIDPQSVSGGHGYSTKSYQTKGQRRRLTRPFESVLGARERQPGTGRMRFRRH